MVYKVQVMSDEEAKKYSQWQTDLDNLCNKIKIIYLSLFMYFSIGLYDSINNYINNIFFMNLMNLMNLCFDIRYWKPIPIENEIIFVITKYLNEYFYLIFLVKYRHKLYIDPFLK